MLDQLFEKIAQEALGLETLAVRNSDSADFHELSVCQIREALRRAYVAGSLDVSRLGERRERVA